MPDSKIVEPTLVVDIGNTNIVCAVFVGGELVSQCRIESTPLLNIEQYYSRLGEKLPEHPIVLFKHIVIGSVVPALKEIWQKLFSAYSNAKIHNIDGLSSLGLGYKTKNRSLVGADLVANAFVAWQNYQGSSIVVDLGTATTLQLISEEGLYAGVVIAPGMKTAAAQLFRKAAQLEDFPLKAPSEVLGNNTQDALCSGIVQGHALMIVGFIREIQASYPQYMPFTVILTGGLAPLIAPLCPKDYIVDSDLTLNGLYQAACHLEQIA